MKKWLQKLPLVAIALMVLFPFLPTPTTSAHDMHHEMSMECMSDEDCEREMQKQCIEHCLEMAQSIEQSAYTLAPSIELALVRTESSLAVSEQLLPSLPTNYSPPLDPRLHRITVQRE